MSKITVVKPSLPPMEEYIEEIRDIWENCWLTNSGPKHRQLCRELSERLGTTEISLFSNGHQALEAAFSLFPAGSEVITTPFTFASTTLAILRYGLVPVFCDIEPEFYTIDAEKIEALITPKTKAIAPIHVYGHLCNWRKIGEIAKRHNLKVIYDAAHAFGVSENGISAAAIGDMAIFSFHATKVFHTIEGGCIAHNDPDISKRFAAWRQFGMFDGERSEILGTNAKLTEFAAAMGLCNLRHLDGEIDLRHKVVARYRERLDGHAGIILCGEQKNVQSNYAYFPVRIHEETFGASRDQVTEKLMEADILARKYFYPITSDFPVVRRAMQPQETPVARTVAAEILCLPLYAGLSGIDVDRVCDALLALCNRK